MCGGSGGGKSAGGGGGGGSFDINQSIYKGAIEENLNRVKSGAITKEASLKQYRSELRKAQQKLKTATGKLGENSDKNYRQNQVNAIKYAISKVKAL